MKTIKKCVLSSAVALALASSASFAEESGAFVGVGVGYGGSQVKSGEKMNLDGISYEIIAGYKQFFTPSFGLRYYANFAYADASGKPKDSSEKIKGNVMDYGVNVDALYNFIADDSLSFGAFLGLGLGLNSWSGSLITGLKDDMAGLGAKVTTSGFGAALNVGLRTEIAKAHGIELAARVPFVATTLVNKDGLKVTATHNYNVGLRYIFSF